MKGIHIGREEVKLSLFEDGIILHIESLKVFPHQKKNKTKQNKKPLLEPVNEFSKVAGKKD